MSVDPSDWVENAARDHPEGIFLKSMDGRQCSYAALRDRSGRFASALMRRGVGAGDRVAVQVDKSVEAVLLYVACLRMGAVFVPINVANTTQEVEYFLSDSQPRVAVVRPADRALLEPLAHGAGIRYLETLGSGQGSLLDLAHESDATPQLRPNAGAGSLAALVYTSGTTGRSKGAMLTRANLASNATALVEAWRFTRRDTLLHALPLFHVHGLFVAINTVLASACSIVLLSKFDAESMLKHLPDVTVYMGVPTHYTRMLQQAGLTREATAHMRLFISGSAPLRAETHQEFRQRTGHVILERYGMTETLMNTSNPYDGLRVPGSVGVPLPGVAIRVVNDEAGTPSAAGIVGALEVAGPNVFAGYWGDADKTRDAFTADGWFKTGDLGRIDEGYVYIVGRARDLVISGGFNVYPKEVETALDALPGVLESAVFGVPHPDLGEGVTAAVVPESGAALSEGAIIESARTQLAPYKIPKRVIFVEELPRNAMGKVRKNALRTAHASLYLKRI